MIYLNDHEIDNAQRAAAEDIHRPNLQMAVLTLARLQEWANRNSDGWHSWPKPCRAASKLQEHVQREYLGRWDSRTEDDITKTQLKAALSPVRSFLTRHGSGTDEVFING